MMPLKQQVPIANHARNIKTNHQSQPFIHGCYQRSHEVVDAINFMGSNWLVVTDAYSKYPCIHATTSVNSSTLSQFKCSLKSQRKAQIYCFFMVKYGQVFSMEDWKSVVLSWTMMFASDNIYQTLIPCGGRFEDAHHYFMSCVYFGDLNTLLYGSTNLSDAENMPVFDAVHKFIMDSRRFE